MCFDLLQQKTDIDFKLESKVIFGLPKILYPYWIWLYSLCILEYICIYNNSRNQFS